MNILKLKAAIMEAGYNQRELAKEMNISINTLNAKLNAKSKMSLDDVLSISDIIGISDDKDKMVEIFLI